MSNEVVTTVITPASTYDLTTLAVAKTELGIATGSTDNDAFISQGITQISVAMANDCNRVFPVETVKDLIYLDRNVRSSVLQLSRWPIAAIASVIEDNGLSSQATLVANTDYILRSDNGQLLRLDGSNSGRLTTWSSSTVTVQFNAGYAAIPGDLALAALRIVTMRFKAWKRDPMLMSKSTPTTGDERYWVGNLPGQSSPFPPEIACLLDNYRVPVFA